MSHLPDLFQCQKLLFKDDIVLWESGRDRQQLVGTLHQALTTLSCYARIWSPEVNHSKSVYSWFTLGSDMLNEEVELRMDGKALAWDKKSKYLGVILDHIHQVQETASEKLNIVKKLAGRKWGARVDVLRGLYMGAVRSHLVYSLPVQVRASQTTLASLYAVQNQAIRLICGTFRTTPIAAGDIMANVPPQRASRHISSREIYVMAT
uniref:Reverse transcriptase domain-containing protein n=1 Tax=Biomphalaria glabrata TaxID=6526 RepID=A0A2C9LLQ6_BIOGL